MSPWFKRFADLPLLRIRPVFPRHDGDTASLHQLADDILQHPARRIAQLEQRDIWADTIAALDLDPTDILNHLDEEAR